MKYLNQKDKKRRELFKNFEQKRILLNYLLQNANLSKRLRIMLTKKRERLPKNSSITRVRNRCVLTNRGQGIIRGFKISRIRLRDLFFLGIVPGYRKSVW